MAQPLRPAHSCKTRPSPRPSQPCPGAPTRHVFSQPIEAETLPKANTGTSAGLGVNRCLDVEQSRKTVKYSDAQMWSCNLNPDAQNRHVMLLTSMQKFSFYGSVDWSSVYIVANGAGPAPEYADYCLDVTEGKMVNGQAVRWWECNRSDAQRWTWNREHGFISPVLRPDLCLDPMGGT
ncbi:hypothetical protein BCR44DRAFT_1215751 [Catenaria anguillulae PL171]|uniref:Ricin B lectin domain-containing protein n=1 Tax=Catenaria anguillulae PL171 TaxID=765915 RepID=A0A1Y2I321_9FUNG|nr:hypothetical protein BCR44DRAFT_1215751 [Catenaria anguillulae PL171]